MKATGFPNFGKRVGRFSGCDDEANSTRVNAACLPSDSRPHRLESATTSLRKGNWPKFHRVGESCPWGWLRLQSSPRFEVSLQNPPTSADGSRSEEMGHSPDTSQRAELDLTQHRLPRGTGHNFLQQRGLCNMPRDTRSSGGWRHSHRRIAKCVVRLTPANERYSGFSI